MDKKSLKKGKKKALTDDELDALLVEASEEAEKRGEPDELGGRTVKIRIRACEVKPFVRRGFPEYVGTDKYLSKEDVAHIYLSKVLSAKGMKQAAFEKLDSRLGIAIICWLDKIENDKEVFEVDLQELRDINLLERRGLK